MTGLYRANLVQVDGSVDEIRLIERAESRHHKPLAARLSELLFLRIPLCDPDPWLNRVRPLIDRVLSGPVLGLLLARTGGVACGAVVEGRWQVGLMGFKANDGAHELVLAVHLGAAALPEDEARACIATFLGLPALYEAGRLLRVGEHDAARLAQTLEIIGRVQEGTGFEQAALALVNDLAQGFGADTVSLSQHCELAWPGGESQAVIVRAHARYAQLQSPGYLLPLPLPLPLQTQTDTGTALVGWGAVTLERQRAAFTPAEQWALRLIGDLALPALRRLEALDRPLPRRLASEVWRSLPAMLKPHTAPGRRLAIGLALAGALVLLVPLPYQVDAGAVVKADEMAFVGAPFDGYIESSQARLGSAVKAGDVLFTLATRELTLDRASLLAEIAQHTREAEKRRSANQLPEMQIAEAQAAQSAARPAGAGQAAGDAGRGGPDAAGAHHPGRGGQGRQQHLPGAARSRRRAARGVAAWHERRGQDRPGLAPARLDRVTPGAGLPAADPLVAMRVVN